MVRPLTILLCAFLLPSPSPKKPAAELPPELSYTAAGLMKFPANYREWIYLTSGLGMSYNPAATASGHLMYDNVFVNPTSYKAFLDSGTWPDKTVFLLEIRGSETKASIDQRGTSQSPELMGAEVHVKDASLPGGWGFFEFDDDHRPAKLTARPATCYTCHEAHAAVDTTFVQFYPTLIGIAKDKKTLSPAYLRDMQQMTPKIATPGAK